MFMKSVAINPLDYRLEFDITIALNTISAQPFKVLAAKTRPLFIQSSSIK